MRERRFLALWAATGGANLADGITLVLLPVAAVLSGASPAGVAAVTVVGTLAWPVLGLPAGWVVDRVDRGRLLVAANVVRAAVIAAVATAAAVDGLALPVLLAAAAVAGALEAIVDSALTALVPAVVDEADRTRANARIETTINLTNQLIGAPLAGFLAGIALSTAFGVAAALYAAAAAVALVLLGGPRAVAPATAETAVVDARVRAGLVYLWAHPLLRQLTLVTAAMNMVDRLNASFQVSERCHSRLACSIWMTCSRSAGESSAGGERSVPRPVSAASMSIAILIPSDSRPRFIDAWRVRAGRATGGR